MEHGHLAFLLQSSGEDSLSICSGMACVLKGSHSFTCTPCVHLLTEWTTAALYFPAEAGPHYQPQRDGRLSWPWVAGYIPREVSGIGNCTWTFDLNLPPHPHKRRALCPNSERHSAGIEPDVDERAPSGSEEQTVQSCSRDQHIGQSCH